MTTGAQGAGGRAPAEFRVGRVDDLRARFVAVLPGLALVIALAVVARASTAFLPQIVSEVTVGIALGLVVANLTRLPPSMKPGIKLAMGPLLRLGIVLLGARLSFGDVLATGLGALIVIAACMAFALAAVVALGRLVGLPPRLAALIAVGTAVCGNSAIAATAPAIEAEERDVSFAVATITLFGTLAVLLYPLIGHALGLSDRVFGHWAGLAVNDTSQVTATGFAYSTAAGDTATVVKLTRNTLMGPLIVVIGALYLQSGMARAADKVQRASRLRWLKLVPLFVVGFIALAAVNSLGLIPAGLEAPISESSRALILVALVGVGLNTDVSRLREVGPRPLYVGFLAATALSLLALGLASIVAGGA
jgi:uncharacterized integral membrane protein (TIGR00698 family)